MNSRQFNFKIVRKAFLVVKYLYHQLTQIHLEIAKLQQFIMHINCTMRLFRYVFIKMYCRDTLFSLLNYTYANTLLAYTLTVRWWGVLCILITRHRSVNINHGER